MIEKDHPDQAPEDQLLESFIPPSKGRPSFAKVRRELSEEELSSPAVQRLLLDELERLERESARLETYQDRYYKADRLCAVYEERSRTTRVNEVLSVVCLTVGSAALGYAPSLWTSQPSGWISIVLGSALIIGGIAAKVIKR